MIDGTIETFLTAFTGELFALLRSNSILISDDVPLSFNQEVFMTGIKTIENLGEADLLHALFSTRSKQVLGEMASSDALSYLSGLIVGADVDRATKLFDKHYGKMPVTVIGEPALTDRYLLALKHFGLTASGCDPAEIAISGFDTIYQHIYQS